MALVGSERAIATELAPNVHYERIAEALGGYGEYVTDPAEIGPAIRRGLASGQPSIINVIVDPAGVLKAAGGRAYGG
jgi:acetolactate synthase-1/2/3 large subunit